MPELDCYAVLGHPVAHSRSPWIHQRFAQLTGVSLRYERLLCPLDGFESSLRAFALGGAKGCNVTVPFKFDAYALAGQASARAQLAQAANTLRFDDPSNPQQWIADNTDGLGLVHDLQHNAGEPLATRRILLLGAGGASAGVLGPLLQARPAALVLANRSLDKAQSLVDRHQSWAQAHGVHLSAATLDAPGEGFDLLVNGTAASLSQASLPLHAGVVAPQALVVDMMYGAAAHPFLQQARDLGARTRDGLGMLVEQAAESFAIWRGLRPPTAQVLAELRQLVDGGSSAS